MSRIQKLAMRFNRIPIRKQLYRIYTVVVVVPILLIGSFLLMYTHHMMENYYTDLLEADNYRVRNILFDITREVYGISRDISFDDGVRTILSGEFGSRQEYMRAVDRNEVLSRYASTYAEVSKIEIYTDNPSLSDYKQFVRIDENIEETQWYRRAMEQAGVFWQAVPWEDGYRDRNWELCLVKRVQLINSPYHAALVIHIDSNYLQVWVDNTEYGSVMSVDRGAVFYSSDRKRNGKGQPLTIAFDESYFQYAGRIRIDGHQCFVNVSTLHAYQSGSKIYICTLDRHGYDHIRNVLYICGAIIAVALIIPGILIHIFTNYFTGRVRLLRQEMHKVSNQDYELIPAFRGSDELSEAFGDLQVMVGNIKEQEARAYEAQIKEQALLIRQQEMEFKMLASQINPHFLYNTLETIRMKALTAGDREAATAIKLLGKSMRYVLENMGTSYTTLEAELKHVDEYMEIQKLRFGSRIGYQKNIAEGVELSHCAILPLLLQPVVENAVVHGLDETEENGMIVISVYTKKPDDTELLLIDVDDNGCGMSEEALNKLRTDIEIRDMSRSKSIGLYNINQRMKLHYGEGYRLHMYSERGMGTRVRLMIPKKAMENQKR
ncbi:MAG: sensor histidine kinase [Lachnospiraceae bacterium]|nr:sensor histidine kinase [Lachnospiraceae bacterium]